MDKSAVYDKHGIPIKRGDIVKVFHFIGPRRKRFYMYKQCIGVDTYRQNGTQYLFFSHLNFNEDIGTLDGPYHECLGQKLEAYEIIQSVRDDFLNRPRIEE